VKLALIGDARWWALRTSLAILEMRQPASTSEPTNNKHYSSKMGRAAHTLPFPLQFLLYCHRFREVPGLIHVASAA
jgi:hypothetical protein